MSFGDVRRISGKRRRSQVMSQINVTPMVDVMTVLLAIFMITAPMLVAGVPVDLPKAQAKSIHKKDDTPLEVSINKDGEIYMGETEVQLGRLRGILQAIAVEGADRRVYIQADRTLPYDMVMQVMGAVSSSGFTKIALITDPKNMVK